MSILPIWRKLLLGLLLLGLQTWAGAQTWLSPKAPNPTVVDTGQVRAQLLVHAPQGAAPGQSVWLGLQLQHAPDWHTYWKNPGDSGLPTEFQWTLPADVTVSNIQWPTPQKFPLGPLANYGYDGTVLLPVQLNIGQGFQGDTLNVSLMASWLACRTECIPEEGEFRLAIPVNAASAQHRTEFEEAWARVPTDMAVGASTIEVEGGSLLLNLHGLPTAWRDQPLTLFPETPAIIEPGAPWTQSWRDGVWQAKVPLSAQRSESPTGLPLVLVPANVLAGVRIAPEVKGPWPEVTALPTPIPDALNRALQANDQIVNPTAASPWSWLPAVLGALLGGVILNLMPCVFPVLAIKVLAFAQAGQEAQTVRNHRAQGLAYTAGVVLSFVALGGLLLGLRAAGEQLGWGFQLQSPTVVAALALLFTLIGLNLSGLFEFGSVLPSSLASWQARNPTVDAFFTGVLATAIASPCTAPFMGASLGLAIALPTGQALAVFAALGLGMALPYALASWWPAVARSLPKPGAWMNTLRHGLAFPMYATVVWLLWVLGQQSGIDGAAALLMVLVALSALIWAMGLGGRARTTVGGLCALTLLAVLWALGPNITRETPTRSDNAETTVEGLIWERWTPERQQQALDQGRPVFVDFTAAWCVTCQYNKRTTLANADVLQDMATKQVVLLRADWTRRDPQVTQALTSLGRSGVPVYALMVPQRPTQLLSEVLTVDEVRAALAQL